jgi:hypothetical protein
MTKKQTPMQELIEWLDKEIENNFIRDAPIATSMNQSPFRRIKSKAIKLVEKEKENMGVVFISGMDYIQVKDAPNFETYYQETFIQ